MTITPAIARAYLGAGLSVVPAVRNGSEKRVALDSWKAFQQRRSTEAECDGWFARPGQSIAIVCGVVSGHCEAIDFDAKGEAWNAWRDHIREEQPDLYDRLVIESTPSGGKHVFYRCDSPVDRQLDLAQRRIDVDGPEEVERFGKRLKPKKDANGQWYVVVTLIETRGEGHLCLCAPSEGYVLEQGSLTDLPVISAEERESLLTAARLQGDLPKTVIDGPQERKTNGTSSDGNRPGDDFNRRGDVREILQQHGWRQTRAGENEHWCRPGKERGTSATLRDGVFYVFSSNAHPFEAENGYRRFAVYTFLEHNGDFRAAAKALAAQGYGEQKSRSTAAHQKDDHSTLLTDVGNAARFVRRFKGRVLYCYATGQWYIWNKRCWRADDTGRVMRLAKKVVLTITDETRGKSESERDDIVRWWKKSQQRERIVAMLALAQSEVAVTLEEFDRDPWLFNCRNGTIDLHAGILRPHDPRDLITKLAPVEFDPSARCPRFDRFLMEITGNDASVIDFLQRFLGYSLAGDITEQYLFIFHGEGNNGKSVLLDTVAEIMGPYAMEAPPNLLTKRGHEEHPTEIADLCGARLVIASETEEAAKLRMQLVKRLTGNAKLKARFMRRDYFEFPRTFKLILVTNNLPQIDENTEAVWRRLVQVPFNVIIAKKDRDPKLPARLRAERSGILNWLVAGCIAWHQRGLSQPVVIERSSRSLRHKTNSLFAFADAECELGPEYAITSAELSDAYERWCHENRQLPLQGKAFGTALRELGCEPGKLNQARSWQGIALRDSSVGRKGRKGRQSCVDQSCISHKGVNGELASNPSFVSQEPVSEAENNDSGRSEWSL